MGAMGLCKETMPPPSRHCSSVGWSSLIGNIESTAARVDASGRPGQRCDVGAHHRASGAEPRRDCPGAKFSGSPTLPTSITTMSWTYLLPVGCQGFSASEASSHRGRCTALGRLVAAAEHGSEHANLSKFFGFHRVRVLLKDCQVRALAGFQGADLGIHL